MKKVSYRKLSVSILAPLVAGFLGSAFTTPAVRTWYFVINKPVWNPPSWLFAPVWTVLFVLMGIAYYLVWSAKPSNKKRVALKVYWAQLFLNVLWSVFFFGMHNFWLAFLEIIVLWISIALTIVDFHMVNKATKWLLIPYILWVSFAAYLNFTVAFLN